MNRYRSFVYVALAVLHVTSFSLLAAAGSAARAVPLKGSFDGTNSRTPLSPPFVVDTLEVSGQLTHLGAYELVITAVVNTATRSAVGTYEFVAANGDTLTAEFEGHSVPTDTPGVILIIEEAKITGGTGRFAGATGTFTTERLFTPATGETVGDIEGSISLK